MHAFHVYMGVMCVLSFWGWNKEGYVSLPAKSLMCMYKYRRPSVLCVYTFVYMYMISQVYHKILIFSKIAITFIIPVLFMNC